MKHASSADAFAVAVTDFYAKHAALVAESLLMAADQAEAYCASQAAQVLGERGIGAMAEWSERMYAAGLVAWALESEAA